MEKRRRFEEEWIRKQKMLTKQRHCNLNIRENQKPFAFKGWEAVGLLGWSLKQEGVYAVDGLRLQVEDQGVFGQGLSLQVEHQGVFGSKWWFEA